MGSLDPQHCDCQQEIAHFGPHTIEDSLAAAVVRENIASARHPNRNKNQFLQTGWWLGGGDTSSEAHRKILS
jgi:hypothetical protein